MALKLKAKRMSEQNITNEALELVKEAQSAKVFNLADAIKGRAYPTTSVKVYLDDQAALELVEVNQLMNRTTDADESAVLAEKAKELAEKIIQSSLTFNLRGIGQAAIEAVTDKMDAKYGVKADEDGISNPEWLKDYITTLVSLNIVSVEDSSGAVDNSGFDFAKVDELRKTISPTEWGKLVAGMQKLTLAGGYFEQLTDAGFLQKS
jgi:hypothetical protein